MAMVFDDLAPRQEDVRLAGKSYVLIEASEEDAAKWRNAAIRAARMKDGKVVGMGDVAGSQALLVGFCLHDASTMKPVGASFVDQLPTRIAKQLFEKAKELSDLGEKEDDAPALRKRIAELQAKLAELEEDAEPDPTQLTSS